jgi:hypothetical protein
MIEFDPQPAIAALETVADNTSTLVHNHLRVSVHRLDRKVVAAVATAALCAQYAALRPPSKVQGNPFSRRRSNVLNRADLGEPASDCRG